MMRTVSNKKALLLDFDGVVLRNCKAHSTVSMKCQRFMANHIPHIRNPIKCKELNAALYGVHGHTVLGLQSMGVKTTVPSFNSFVYDGFDYSVFKGIGKTHRQDIDDLSKVFGYCSDNGIRVLLFSNAPDVWCRTILRYMSSDLERAVETCSSVTESVLKPDPLCYTRVEEMLGPRYDHIYFVDDKLINLAPIFSNPKWTSLWLSESFQDETITVKPRLHICSNHGNLYGVVKHVHELEKSAMVR